MESSVNNHSLTCTTMSTTALKASLSGLEQNTRSQDLVLVFKNFFKSQDQVRGSNY